MLQQKKSSATSEENLVQQQKNKIKHLKNCSATSEKYVLQQPKKVPLQHSTSSVATLKMNHYKTATRSNSLEH